MLENNLNQSGWQKRGHANGAVKTVSSQTEQCFCIPMDEKLNYVNVIRVVKEVLDRGKASSSMERNIAPIFPWIETPKLKYSIS